MKKPSEEIFSVILLGTSGVGKSSIAFYLEHGYPPPSNIKPTIAFGISHVEMSNSVLGLIDVGGQKKFLDMRYHERFVQAADGLVFVMDSSQRNFDDDEQWLDEALRLIPGKIPILIIANKQDLSTALSPDFIQKYFIHSHLKGYDYEIFGTVAADPGGVRSGENLTASFEHLITQMKTYRKAKLHQTQLQEKSSIIK
ncbi:MAG: 50S ribosome-binding GTPase [Candidatus Heimdallarchaeota archaeon]|nr:50S ribosome-binding GTPase [Candidatus Heimdallarchaeota archaeon]